MRVGRVRGRSAGRLCRLPKPCSHFVDSTRRGSSSGRWIARLEVTSSRQTSYASVIGSELAETDSESRADIVDSFKR
jgi:hypothetical protein